MEVRAFQKRKLEKNYMHVGKGFLDLSINVLIVEVYKS
jgi:hypothetical protein